MLRARDTFIYSLSNNDKRATINVVIRRPNRTLKRRNELVEKELQYQARIRDMKILKKKKNKDEREIREKI